MKYCVDINNQIVVSSLRLPFKLGDPVPDSILGRTSTHGLKIIEEKELP